MTPLRLALLVLPLVIACGPAASDPASAADAGTVADAGTRPDAGAPGGREDTDALCSDGVSNDGDRYVDCDDYDCSRAAAVTVCGGGGGPDAGSSGGSGKENTDALCSDGVSNDGDRYVDCDDHDCADSAAVTVCSQACFDCLEDVVAAGAVCHAQGAACRAQPECEAIRRCVAGCADDDCDIACQDAHPQGWSTYDPLMACIYGECRSKC